MGLLGFHAHEPADWNRLEPQEDVPDGGGTGDAAQLVLSLSNGQSVEQRSEGDMTQRPAIVGSLCVLPPIMMLVAILLNILKFFCEWLMLNLSCNKNEHYCIKSVHFNCF